MKRAITILLALILAISVFGCASTAPSGSAPQTQPPAPAAASAAPAVASTAPTNGTPAAQPKVLRVGVLLPRSGPATNNSKAAQMAIDAYIEYFEQNIKFKDKAGLEIQWVQGDSESTADGAVSAFERLANFENVDIIMGTSRSVESGPCVPLAIKYQIPFLLLHTVADTLVNTPNDYVFRPTPGDTQEKVKHKEFFKVLNERQGGIKTMAIVYSAEDYGTASANYYREIAKENNVQIVLDESVQIGVADVSGVINKIKSLKPDICITALQINEALLFQRQLKEYKVNVPILTKGAGYLDLSFLGAAKGTAEGVVSSTFWTADALNYLGEEAQKIGKAMMDKAGVKMNEVSVSAWICAGVLMDVIERAETLDRPGLAKALKATNLPKEHPANLFSQYPSISFGEGNGQYNQNQNVAIQFCQIINDEWKVVFPSAVVPDNVNPLIWPPKTN